MFSFSRSGRGPTLPQAGKCPSVAHVRPSIGSGCHSQGTGAGSPRCMPSHYPGPRTKNPPPPPPPRLAPHRAATPDPAQAKRWNLTGWRSRKQQRAGLIGCRRWTWSPGSSSSGKSEDSAQRSQRKKWRCWFVYLNQCNLLLNQGFPTGGPLHRSTPLVTGWAFFVCICLKGAKNDFIPKAFFFLHFAATTGISNSVI